MRRILLVCLATTLSGCLGDPNSEPKFGETGLPQNCRAYIQYAVDSWRSGQYSAEDTLSGIERNCGASGTSWGQ